MYIHVYMCILQSSTQTFIPLHNLQQPLARQLTFPIQKRD